MEKNPDEIPMFTWFAERGLSLPASDFFKWLHGTTASSTSTSTPTVSSTRQSSFISAKPSWESSPTGCFFENSSEWSPNPAPTAPE
jgi:hypothetical protein